MEVYIVKTESKSRAGEFAWIVWPLFPTDRYALCIGRTEEESREECHSNGWKIAEPFTSVPAEPLGFFGS